VINQQIVDAVKEQVSERRIIEVGVDIIHRGVRDDALDERDHGFTSFV
jgi:hypothetical protein